MPSNSLSHRRTIIKRPLVCKSKRKIIESPPSGYYAATLIAETNDTYDDQAVDCELGASSPDLPDNDPVAVDYHSNFGNFTGPSTILNNVQDTYTARFHGTPAYADVLLKVRLTFSNGAVAWDDDSIWVHF